MSLTDTLIQTATSLFESELRKNNKFFSTPVLLEALFALSLELLNNLESSYKSQISMLPNNANNIDTSNPIVFANFIKSDPALKLLLSTASSNLLTDSLSQISQSCNNPNFITPDVASSNNPIINAFNSTNTTPQSIIDAVQSTNSNISKFYASSVLNDFLKIYSITESISILTFMLYYIIQLTIDLISNSKFPSVHRSNYIKSIIYTTLDLVNEMIPNIPSSQSSFFNTIKSSLSLIGSLISASVIGSQIYLSNRKKLQTASLAYLQDEISSTSCSPVDFSTLFSPPVKSPTNKKLDLSINVSSFVCPVPDSYIVPHSPIEDKIANGPTCPVTSSPTPLVINPTITPDLTTSAIIVNDTSTKFTTKLSVTSKVDSNTVIFKIENLSIFSPVIGTVSSISKNSITIDNFIEPSNDFLTSQISILNNAYSDLNNTTRFIRDNYINSIYPLMLQNSIFVSDASILDPNAILSSLK